MKWDGERSEGTNGRADAFSHASEQQWKHRVRILHCVAMPFGSKKGEKKGGTKGHTCVCCCYDKESNNGYRCGTSRLYDGMGWKGNGEWSEMKHELATLGSR